MCGSAHPFPGKEKQSGYQVHAMPELGATPLEVRTLDGGLSL